MHKPPIAKRVPVTSVRHGREVVDEYAWLRDRDDPDTVAYLEAENAHTEEWFAPLADLQEQLFEEIKGRVLETDMSVPARRGPWWYVTRTEEGKQYSIFCRRPERDTVEGEQVLIDSNVLAAGHEYFELGALDVSPSHRLLAYSTDVTGAEVFTIRIRDLDTGTDLPDTIEGTQYGTAWSADDRLPLLHTARRRVAVVPDLASRGRHRRQRRRARLPGGRHPLRRRPLQHAQRSVHRDRDREPDDERGAGCSTRPIRSPLLGSSSRARPASSTASTTKATGC